MLDLRALADAIHRGLRTLPEGLNLDKPRALLLDYFDMSLLNDGIVADAFRGAAEHSAEVQAIDEVFVVENGNIGAHGALPVKPGSRFYPNLDEFLLYREVQYEMSYGSGPSWAGERK